MTFIRLYLVVVSLGGGCWTDRCTLAVISCVRFVICLFLPFDFSVLSSSSLPLSSIALASYFPFLRIGRISRAFVARQELFDPSEIFLGVPWHLCLLSLSLFLRSRSFLACASLVLA